MKLLSRERKFSSGKRGIRVISARVDRVKVTGKWGENQEKPDLVRVSGELELSEFELSGMYCTSKPFWDHTLPSSSNSRTFNDFFHDRFQFSNTSGLAVTCKNFQTILVLKFSFLPNSVQQTQTLVSTKTRAVRAVQLLISLSHCPFCDICNNLSTKHNFP